ncbi:MAG: hypothetical protein ACLUKN_14110 [Bacilli bacterium]
MGRNWRCFRMCRIGYALKDLVFYDKFVDTAQDALHSLAPSIPIQ